MFSSNPFAWEDQFPPVYGHTSISYLKNCRCFNEAKRGDMDAALEVVRKCINNYTIDNIQKRYPEAVLLPVMTNNKLPEALANLIGLKTYTGVYTISTTRRKSLSAMERLLQKPVFGGEIVEGERYIIVDDIITQGGTVSELRKYVITNGGHISAIVTLSYSIGSNIIVPGEEEIFSLINKFSLFQITNTLRNYNIAHEVKELTRAQVRYLLLFKELAALIEKIEKTQAAIII